MEGSCGLVLCCGINMCDIDSIRYYNMWYRYLSMFHYLTCDDIFLNLTSGGKVKVEKGFGIRYEYLVGTKPRKPGKPGKLGTRKQKAKEREIDFQHFS